MFEVAIVEAIGAGDRFLIRGAGNDSVRTADALQMASLLQAGRVDAVVFICTRSGRDGLDVYRCLIPENGFGPLFMLVSKQEAEEAGVLPSAETSVSQVASATSERARRLRAFIHNMDRESVEVVQIGDLVLCPSMHTVSRRGLDVHLLPRDFQLLEFLMRHPSEVFSFASLMSRVWRHDPKASNEGMRAAICRIRKAIDLFEEPDDSLIENIPRIGYKIRTKNVAGANVRSAGVVALPQPATPAGQAYG